MADYKVYKNEMERLKIYRSRIQSAQRKQDKWAPTVRQHFKRYENVVRPDQYTIQGHRVNVPVGIGLIDTLHSALSSTDVDFMVKNLAHGTRDQRRIAEQVIREVWREQRVDRKRSLANKDSIISGIGWVKVGYDFVEEQSEQPRSAEAVQSDIDRIYSGATEEGIEPPSPEAVAALVPTKEQVTKVIRDRIVVDYVSWDDVLWDPTARKLEDIRWICQKILVPVHEVKNNPVYREYAERHGHLRELDSIKADATIDAELRYGREAGEDDDRVCIYQYHDMETGTICDLLRDGNFKLYEQYNPFANEPDLEDRSPFVPIVVRITTTDVRGVGEMDVIAPSLDELNIYRSNLATFLERFKPKIKGPAGALTTAGKAALQSQEWGAYVEFEPGMAADVSDMQVPPLPQEFFGMQDRIINDMREGSGITEAMRGQFAQGTPTATESAAVQAGGQMSQGEKFDNHEYFLNGIARRILKLAQMFYDAPRVARMVDLEGDVLWEYTAEDIIMEYDLEVRVVPKEVDSFENRYNKAMMMLNLLGPLPEVDKVQLVRTVMEDLGFDADTIRQVLLTPAEQQQAAQQQAAQVAMEQQAADGVAPQDAAMGADVPDEAPTDEEILIDEAGTQDRIQDLTQENF